MRSKSTVIFVLVLFALLACCWIAGAQSPQSWSSVDLERRVAVLESQATARGRPGTQGYKDARIAGAIGDGKADDGPALQRAINDLHAAGGGTLFFPPGTYRITGAGLKLLNKVTLQGVDVYSTKLFFDQPIAREYLINLHNVENEYAPSGQRVNDIRIVTIGAGAIRDDSTPWSDGVKRGWHGGGMRNVVIDGGARAAYSIDLPNYCQKVILENVSSVNFLGPFLRINGNCNILRSVGPDGFADGKSFRNMDRLPMMMIDGDSNVLEDSIIETFSGFPAISLKGHRHRILRVWAESDGPVPDGAWIVLNDAHHVLFDFPHLLVEGTHRLKMINSDATALLLEPKHIQQSLDLDAVSSLTVVVPARAMSPGVHVVADPKAAH
jgi:hypothetical protein